MTKNSAEATRDDCLHIHFNEFTRLGWRRLSQRSVPCIVDMGGALENVSKERILEVLGDSTVALFKKSKDPRCPLRSEVIKIPLKEFFDESVYNRPDDPFVYRIVTNIRNRPHDIKKLLGMEMREIIDSEGGSNSINLWINYKGQFGRTHFDELENFNIQLVGRKRFLLYPPGFRDYYTRSIVRGFGHHSEVPNFDDVDFVKYPRLRKAVAQKLEFEVGPGQMLYLPIGWWHQVHPLDHLNVNLNFWLWSWKILRQPYVFVDSLYKVVFRRLMGVYDYQPEQLGHRQG